MNSISFIGSHLLSLAFPAALYSFLMYAVGYRKSHEGLIKSARRANILTFILLTSAVVLLIAAFITNDYSILYVYSYSSRSLPLFFKVTGLWAGLDGSILFWTWLVSLYALIVLLQGRNKHPDWMPAINGTMMFIILFFLVVMVFARNPFSPMAQEVADGRGLNPLLQNIAMVVHPPSLYLGFTGFSVPFAFVIAALLTRRLDSTWIEETRRWTIIAWFFLTLGLILGGAWAYVELGWGGFWAWDPVENAALMPWLTATAYLHSVITQQKRGMLQIWNVMLLCLTFLFTIFGTYLTRSGVVQSVHAFSESNMGPYFLGFLLFLIIVSFYLIVTRKLELTNQNVLQSFFSKESAFLVNNVLFLVAAFAVVWGTMFPTMAELFTGQRITVGPPFFNRIMAPLALAILFLMGAGPMISWRKASNHNMKGNLLIPFIVGLVAGVIAFFLGVQHWYSLLTVILIVFVLGTLFIEFYRGIRLGRIQKGLSPLASFVDLLIHSNRRYGGYIVHLGVLLILGGIAGAVYQTQADFALNPGESYEFKGYRFQYVMPLQKETEHKFDLVAHVDLYKGDKKLDELFPAKYFYKGGDEQVTTEVDIYHTAFQDVYLLLGNMNPNTGRAELRITINPLISYIWLGGFVILLGVVVVLLPRGLKMKPATTAAVALFILLTQMPMGDLQAQQAAAVDGEHGAEMPHDHDSHGGTDPFENAAPDDPFFNRLKSVSEKLICQCGGCVRETLRICTCTNAKKERAHIATMMNDNKTDGEIIQSYVNQYGMRVLTVPPEEGFFKVGYWMPLVALVITLGLILLLIRKWSRRGQEAQISSVPTTPAADNAYARRLEEELKDY